MIFSLFIHSYAFDIDSISKHLWVVSNFRGSFLRLQIKFFGFLVQGKGEFAMEYSKYLAASQQVQAELMEKYDLERLKKAKSR